MQKKRTQALNFWTVELLKLLPSVLNFVNTMHPHFHARGWCDYLAMLLN
ncbi:hypothetical protein E7V67_011505 [[Empedobacter] haloabium]|uniref:Uncharacterized protein n=1 Tax=[Empedobacter] haloabium TaxID=592317 RepID=A0ABZ1USJ5_9BURK